MSGKRRSSALVAVWSEKYVHPYRKLQAAQKKSPLPDNFSSRHSCVLPAYLSLTLAGVLLVLELINKNGSLASMTDLKDLSAQSLFNVKGWVAVVTVRHRSPLSTSTVSNRLTGRWHRPGTHHCKSTGRKRRQSLHYRSTSREAQGCRNAGFLVRRLDNRPANGRDR